METGKVLESKYILIVDDEQDVLDQLTELLDMCRIDTATSYEEAKERLEKENYDLAILDIMGVRGFDLLTIATERRIPALMLTAHAMSEENLKKSAEQGAAYYAPKDEMAKIELFAADVIEAVEKKKSPWIKFFERLTGFYDKKFHGTDWREQEKEFWEEKTNQLSGI